MQKLRFAFWSLDGDSLFYWARLVDEGHEVLVYVKNPDGRSTGLGIVPKTNNLLHWQSWGLQDPKTVFVFDVTGGGELADSLRKRGALVVGGGKFMDRLEHDRHWGESAAQNLGITVPKAKNFSSIPDALAAAKKLDGEYVFKTDKYLEGAATYLAESGYDMVKYLTGLHKRFGNGGKCLLAPKIPGIAISTGCWWNGREALYPIEGTIEHKKFLNGDLGPNTGCSFNAMWFYQDEDPRIAQKLQWRAMESFFRHSQAPPGLYDINALISDEDGEAYFLEWTPRFGYDSEATAQRILTMSLGEFFYKLATGELHEAPFDTSKMAYGLRVSVPPYPYEFGEERTYDGAPIAGADGLWENYFVGYGVREEGDDLVVAGDTGIVGVIVDAGTDVETMDKACLKYLKEELKVPNRQYRTDGAQTIQEDQKRLAKLGYKSLLGA
jgi:phosphoribosylamine---glycine ligase